MPGDDPVDETSLVFTEADVFMVTGYLAERWGVEREVVADTEAAIAAVLEHVVWGGGC